MKIREANTLIKLGYMKLQFVQNNVRKRMEIALKRHSELRADNPELTKIEKRVMDLNEQLFEICTAIDILRCTQGGIIPFVDKDGNRFALLVNGEPVYVGYN